MYSKSIVSAPFIILSSEPLKLKLYSRRFNLPRSFRVERIELKSPIYVYMLKGVNYYPSTHPWNAMYDDTWWSSGKAESEIKKELDLIASLGCNVIRIFAIYSALGGATINPTRRGYLENIINWAYQRGIKSIVTLFDGLSGADFDPPNWSAHESHLNGIVGYFANSDAILMWDLKNEYPLIYSPIDQAKTEAWARHMILKIKSLDTKHPVSAESDAATTQWLADIIDVCASHLYKDNPDDNPSQVDIAYSISKGRPYYCGETGWSHAIFGNQSIDTRDRGPLWAEEYLRRTLNGLSTKDCGVLVWTSFEYPTLAYNDRERWFGITTSAYPTPTYRYKRSALDLAKYKPIPVASPRRLFVDKWSITEDFQNFETSLGLTSVSGTWSIVSDTQQDGTSGKVAEQSNTTYLGGWDGKVAVTSLSISTAHIHVESWMKLQVSSGSQECGVVFGYTDINNTYRAYINRYYNVFALKKVSAGAETLLAQQSVTINAYTWYKITVTLHNNTYNNTTYNNIRIFLNDGALGMISYDDSSPLPSGKAGIYTQGNTVARFNDYHAWFITKQRIYL